MKLEKLLKLANSSVVNVTSKVETEFVLKYKAGRSTSTLHKVVDIVKMTVTIHIVFSPTSV